MTDSRSSYTTDFCLLMGSYNVISVFAQ